MSPANSYVKQPYQLDKKPHNSSRNHNITRQATVLALTYLGPSAKIEMYACTDEDFAKS